MALRAVPCHTEILLGKGPGGDHYFGSVTEILPKLPEKASLCYLDPPFFTGKDFAAYSDRWDSQEEYLRFLKQSLLAAVEALLDDASLFVHVDYRASAHVRIYLDELLGEDAFRNEIIWAYNSGGRAKQHFSRKHDNILYYALKSNSFFDPMAVALPRESERHNHMKREVDADGRTYRSIRSAGKEYRYYDDELVPLSDVWTDIAHLQQKDPERCGYPTQKPLKLIRRILRCASRSGDLILDGFAGSGTSYLAAALEGRRFVGCDSGYVSLCTIRRRLLGYSARLHVENAPRYQESPVIERAKGRFAVRNALFCSLGKWEDGTYTHQRWNMDENGELTTTDDCNALFCATAKGQSVYIL